MLLVFYVLSVAVWCTASEGKIPLFISQDARLGGSNLFAMLMLLGSPSVDVVGIGVIGGDSTIKDATFGTMQMLEVLNRTDIPLAVGSHEPFLNSKIKVEGRAVLHGPKGGDGWIGEWGPHAPRGEKGVLSVPGFPEPDLSKLDKRHASQLLVDMANKYDGRLVLYTGGPLTDVALATLLDPEIGGKVAEVHTMAGSLKSGSRFNFWWDAESAARFVHYSKWPAMKSITPIDVCESTIRFSADLFARLVPAGAAEGNRAAEWLRAMFEQDWVEFGLPIWDEVTVAVMLDREAVVAEERDMYISVDVTEGWHYGATIALPVDSRRALEMPPGVPAYAYPGKLPWRVVTKVHDDQIERLFTRAIHRLIGLSSSTESKTEL